MVTGDDDDGDGPGEDETNTPLATTLFLEPLGTVWSFPILPIVGVFIWWQSHEDSQVIAQDQSFVLSSWVLWVSMAMLVKHEVNIVGFFLLLAFNLGSWIFLRFYDATLISNGALPLFIGVYFVLFFGFYFLFLVTMKNLRARGRQSRLSVLMYSFKRFFLACLGTVTSAPLAVFVPLWQLHFVYKSVSRGGARARLGLLMLLPMCIAVGASALGFYARAPTWRHATVRLTAFAATFTAARVIFWNRYIVEYRLTGGNDTKILPLPSKKTQEKAEGEKGDKTNANTSKRPKQKSRSSKAMSRVLSFDWNMDSLWNQTGRQIFLDHLHRGIESQLYDAEPGAVEKMCLYLFEKFMEVKNWYSTYWGFRGKYVRYKFAAQEAGEIGIQTASILTAPVLGLVNCIQAFFVALNAGVTVPFMLNDKIVWHRDAVIISEGVFDIIYIVFTLSTQGSDLLDYSTFNLMTLLVPLICALHFMSQVSDEYIWALYIEQREKAEIDDGGEKTLSRRRTVSNILGIEIHCIVKKKHSKRGKILILVATVFFSASMSFLPILRFLSTKDYCTNFTPGQMVDPGCSALEWAHANLTDEMLPRHLGKLSGVKRVDASSNKLTSLSSFVEMSGLISLDLSNNDIHFISSDIQYLKHLRVLNISNNDLKEISLEVTSLPSLVELRYEGNSVTVIEYVWKERKMKLSIRGDMLDLSGQEIDVIDAELESIILRHAYGSRGLNLSENDIQSVPSSLFHAFKSITLRNNKLKEIVLPQGLADGYSSFDIFGNPIARVDASWWRFFNVSEYKTDAWRASRTLPFVSQGEECLISHTPWDIQCKGRVLDLSDLSLTGFALDIGRLPSLEHLILKGNHLTSLNGVDASKLLTLDLRGNKIASTDDLKTVNVSYTALVLDGNPLASIRGSAWCSKFQVSAYSPIYLAHEPNIITGDCDCLVYSNPSWAVQCNGTKLRFANYSAHLPSMYAKLRSLTALNATSAGLTGLSDELTSLKNLRVLDISFNRLQRIDLSIQDMPLLQDLIITGNPFVHFDASWTSRFSVKTYTWEGPLQSKHFLNARGDPIDDCIYSYDMPHPFSLQCGGRYLTVADCGETCDSIAPEIRYLTSVFALKFTNNSLSNIPHELSKMPKLLQLDLSFNKITSIPSAEWLKKLWYLKIAGNPISKVDNTMISWFEDEFKVASYKAVNILQAGVQRIDGCECLRYHSGGEIMCKGKALKIEPGNGVVENSLGALSITRLEISNAGLRSLPDNFFYDFLSLEEIDLSMNHLISLPTSLGSLSSLHTLDVSNNEIMSVSEVTNVPQLETLDCSYNNITTIPSNLFTSQHIKTINAAQNQIEHVPKLQTMDISESLESINLGGNPGIDLALLVEGSTVDFYLLVLPSWSSSEVVDMRNKYITDENADRLAKGMEQLVAVRQLFLDSNQLGDKGIEIIAKVLENGYCAKLEVLSVNNNRIGNTGINAISSVLSKLPSLSTLSILGNAYDIFGLLALEELSSKSTFEIEFDVADDMVSNLAGREYSVAEFVEIGKALRLFPDLESLDLSFCSITQNVLPGLLQGFAHIPNLKLLNLSSNFIDDVGNGLIGDALFSNNFSKLETISLKGNKLGALSVGFIADRINRTASSGLPSFLDSLSLLDLSDNAYKISVVSESMQIVLGANIGWTGGEDTVCNIATAYACQAICKSTNNCCGFVYNSDGCCYQKYGPGETCVSLFDKNDGDTHSAGIIGIAENPRTIQLFYDAMRAYPALKVRIDLDTNWHNKGFDDGAIHQIANALSLAAPAQEIIDVSENDFGAAGMTRLAESLKHVPYVKALRFSYNNVTNVGAKALAGALHNVPDLLRIYANNMAITEQGCNDISMALNFTPKLDVLAYGIAWSDSKWTSTKYRNILGTGGCRVLGGQLEKIPRLLALYLDYVDVGAEGMEFLANGFQFIPQLKSLYLIQNDLKDRGAAALAGSFQHIPSLATLWLDANNITAEGMASFASSASMPNLESFSISDNVLKTEGASEFAKFAEKVPNLGELWMVGNELGDEGVGIIASALKHLPKLEYLGLNSNDISDIGAEAIADAITSCPDLKTLYIHGNPKITSVGRTYLGFAKQNHPNDPAIYVYQGR